MPLAGLRQTVRSLRRRPAFALASILTVALGIGANTAVYQVIYTVLLRPLPFRDPGDLVQLWESTPVLPQLQVTFPDFFDWRSQTHSFSHMAAYTFQEMNRITLTGQGEPEIVQATDATHDLFTAMGIQPLLGRMLNADDEAARRPVALISEKLWRRKFAADPAVVGRSMRFETQSFTVIGVVPARQSFPPWADAWMPFSWADTTLRQTRKYHPLEVVARLKPGVTVAQAQAEIHGFAARLAAEHRDTNGTVGAYAIPLARQITGEVRPALLLVWGAVGLVLLIACANLAHMLMARMLDRRQEIAIRAALGAGRAQLARMMLSESLVLAIAGGLTGAIFAQAAGIVLARLAQGRIPRLDPAGFTGAAPLFALCASLFCGLLFGLPACWQILHGPADPISGRTVTRRRSKAGSVLIAAEVALAFVVLAGAALVIRSFARLLDQPMGFDPKGVLTMEVPLPTSRYDDGKSAQLWKTRLLPSIQALPGVESVAVSNCAPMSLTPTGRFRFATRFGIQGRNFDPGHYPVAQYRWLTPDYFRVLGIPLERGRLLTEADRDRPRFVINEALARQFFPHEDPTTRRLVMGVMDPQQSPTEIVGVVGDVREIGLDEPVGPVLYEISGSPRMVLLVKTTADPMRLAQPVREIIHRADPEIAILRVAPLEKYVDSSLAQRRFALTLLAGFAILAALLTAAGIYGLLAYSVSARLREMGIRSALGASPARLNRMIFREGLAVALPGLCAGLLAASACARFVAGMLYRVAPLDPLSLGAAAAILLAITILSVWLPARRASRVDPAVALRLE